MCFWPAEIAAAYSPSLCSSVNGKTESPGKGKAQKEDRPLTDLCQRPIEIAPET